MAPGGKVTGEQLRDRVRYGEGAVIWGNSANKPEPALSDQPRPMATEAMELPIRLWYVARLFRAGPKTLELKKAGPKRDYEQI